jgi:hypothetical protein
VSIVSQILIVLGAHFILFAVGIGVTAKVFQGIPSISIRSLAAPTGLIIISCITPIVSTVLRLNIGHALIVVSTIFLLYTFGTKVSILRFFTPLTMYSVLSLSVFITFFAITLKIGTENYLGVINPDFIQSWSFLDQLLNGKVYFYEKVTYFEDIFTNFYPSQSQAKFGLVSAGYLIAAVFGLESSAALIVAMMISIAYTVIVALNLSKYLSSSNKNKISDLIIFLSSSTLFTSFIYVFVGQNGGLVLIPYLFLVLVVHKNYTGSKSSLLISVLFLASTIIYIPILPFMILIVGFYFASLAIIERLGLQFFAKVLMKISAMYLLFLIIFWRATQPVISGFIELIMKVSNSEARNLFLDWLSPNFLTYLFGVSPSPIWNSFWSSPIFQKLGGTNLALIVTVFLAFLLAKEFLVVFRKSHAKSFWISILGVSSITFFFYFFIQESGFFLFKFSSWFWFLIPIVLIYLRNNSRNRILVHILITIYVVLNVATIYQYNSYTLGSNKQKGTIVNSYGNTNREDLRELLDLDFLRGSTVALALSNIDSMLVSAYLRESVQEIFLLSQSTLPIDNRYLPNRKNYYRDGSGQEFFSDNKYQPDAPPEFIVYPSRKNPNQSVVRPPKNVTPVWSNNLYAIFRNTFSSTYIVSGRGLERTEYLVVDGAEYPSNAFYSGFEVIVYNYTGRSALNLVVEFDITNESVLGSVGYLTSKEGVVKEFELHRSQKIVVPLSRLSSGKNIFTVRIDRPLCPIIPRLGTRQIWCQVGKLRHVSELTPETNSKFTGQLIPKDFLDNSLSYKNVTPQGWLLRDNEIQIESLQTSDSCRLIFFVDDFESKLSNPFVAINVDGVTTKTQLTGVGSQTITLQKAQPPGASSRTTIAIEYPAGSRSDKTIEPKRGSVRLNGLNCS